MPSGNPGHSLHGADRCVVFFTLMVRGVPGYSLFKDVTAVVAEERSRTPRRCRSVEEWRRMGGGA